MASPVPWPRRHPKAIAIGDEGGERGSALGAKLGRGGGLLLLSAIGREEEAAAAVAMKSELSAHKRRKGRCIRFTVSAIRALFSS